MYSRTLFRFSCAVIACIAVVGACAVLAFAGDGTSPAAALPDPAVIGQFVDMLPPAWKVAILRWSPLVALVATILLKVSEYLSMTQRFQSNGILQALANVSRSVLKLFPVAVLLVLAACASVHVNCNSGQPGNSQKQSTNDSTKLDGNSATANPNVSLVPK